MASGQTQYYGLSQWEAADKVERVDFNSDNAKIDGALHTLAEQAGRKADKSTVTNLSSVVSQKADETALSAAEGRISDLESGKADKTELAAQIRALSQSHDADTEALRSENCWVKLGTAALAAEQAEMNFNLSGVDLSKFRALELHGELSSGASGSMALLFNHQSSISFHGPNGRSKNYAIFLYNENEFSGMVRIQRSPRAGCMVIYSLNANYGFMDQPDGNSTYTDRLIMDGIQSIQVTSFDLSDVQKTLKGGSNLTLYGLKK